jgi:hypothetical protein
MVYKRTDGSFTKTVGIPFCQARSVTSALRSDRTGWIEGLCRKSSNGLSTATTASPARRGMEAAFNEDAHPSAWRTSGSASVDEINSPTERSRR